MITTRLTFAVLAGLAAAVPAAAAERRVAVAGFDKVLASGSEDITIVTGQAAALVATGPQERLDNLDIRVEGTTLKIDHMKSWNSTMSSSEPVRIAITMPALHGVHGSGSGDIVADAGTGPAFEASSSGSGDMKIAAVTSAAVALRTSGSGDIMVAGRCTDAKISTTGSGDVSAAGLGCTNVDVTITGSGDVAARASGDANIRISGSGDVTITGGARCTSRTSGSGDVRCS